MAAGFHYITNAGELEAALTTLSRQVPDGMFVHSGDVHWAARNQIVSWTTTHRIPGISDVIYFVNAGLLMAYGSELLGQLRRAGDFVDRILRGARPGDLPIEQPTHYELLINLKTARALGLTIPPSLLLRADQVIE